MAWESVRRNWSEWSDIIRYRWIELDARDIAYINGFRHRLIERLEVRYHMTPIQAEKQVGEWERSHVASDDRVEP